MAWWAGKAKGAIAYKLPFSEYYISHYIYTFRASTEAPPAKPRLLCTRRRPVSFAAVIYYLYRWHCILSPAGVVPSWQAFLMRFRFLSPPRLSFSQQSHYFHFEETVITGETRIKRHPAPHTQMRWGLSRLDYALITEYWCWWRLRAR